MKFNTGVSWEYPSFKSIDIYSFYWFSVAICLHLIKEGFCANIYLWEDLTNFPSTNFLNSVKIRKQKRIMCVILVLHW